MRIFEEPTLPKNPTEAFKKLIMPDGYDPETEELERLSREIKELQADITGITEENKRLRATVRWLNLQKIYRLEADDI